MTITVDAIAKRRVKTALQIKDGTQLYVIADVRMSRTVEQGTLITLNCAGELTL